MTMRRIFTGCAIVALGALLMVGIRRLASPPSTPAKAPAVAATASPGPLDGTSRSHESRREAPAVPARQDLEGQPALHPPAPAELSTTERSPLANLLGAPETRPEDEARIVLDVLNTYRRLFGAYPAGEDNRQFVNALLGANRDKLPLIPRDHPRLNARGEIVDAWGTPFFFHLNSRYSIEVRSAGSDRVWYTPDDIVAGKPPAVSGQRDILANDPSGG